MRTVGVEKKLRKTNPGRFRQGTEPIEATVLFNNRGISHLALSAVGEATEPEQTHSANARANTFASRLPPDATMPIWSSST
jgi:hypothetical protein